MKKQKIARVLSDIFIPPTFFLFASFYLPLKIELANNEKVISLLVMLFGLVILPMTYFIHLRRKNKIINRDAVIKEQRDILYIFSFVVCSICLLLLHFFTSSTFIKLVILANIVSSIGVYFINKKIKISIHSLTPAGFTAILLFVSPSLSALSLIITFLLMWSRLTLGVHSFKEVLIGSLYGFFLTYVVIYLGLNYAP